MTDMQILTAAIAVLMPLSLLLLGNTRVADAKETLRAENATLRVEMNARFDRLESKIDGQHDVVMRLLADIDARVTRLEERR